MEYLFIGGATDGKRGHVPENYQDVFMEVPEKSELSWDEDNLPVSRGPIEKERYTRETFYSESGSIQIFALAELSHLDIVKLLIKEYKKR